MAGFGSVVSLRHHFRRALGVSPRFFERLRKRLGELGKRAEALLGIGMLYGSILAVLEAVTEELALIADEEDDQDRGHGLGGRFRIDDR